MHPLFLISEGFQPFRMKNMRSREHAHTLLLHLPRLYLGLWISCFSMAVVVERKTNKRETIIMGTHTHMYKAENVEKILSESKHHPVNQ